MDEIERRIRAARPTSGHRDLPLTDRAKRELAELTLTDDSLPAQARGGGALRRAPARVIAAVSVLVACLVLVPFGANLASSPATALTPPALEWLPTSLTVTDAIDDAIQALESSEGLDEPLRESHSVGWYFHVDVEDEKASRTVISPEVYHFVWREDLSAHNRAFAGTPYWADDQTLALPSDAPQPGDLLWEEVFAPGEYEPILPDVPGETPAEWEAFLQPVAYGDLSSGYWMIDVIDTAMQGWSLTNEQHASLLRLLSNLSDVSVLGITDDRAGRPVFGFSATHPSYPKEHHLFVSLQTGRIIGFETYMVEGDSYFPGNAVISYKLFEVENS